MTAMGLFSTLLTLAALFGVLNRMTLKLPNTIGVLVIALLVSVVMLAADPLIPGISLRGAAQRILGTIDLPATLLNSALSFLLFAGALDVDLHELWKRRSSVLALALLGTVLAIALLACGMFGVFRALGHPVPFAWCVVLGAILAPTDPVAVVGMLRRIGLPPGLQAVFAGESLFNDGVGVVLFGAALGTASAGADGVVNGGEIAFAFVFEAVGGAVLGLATGFIAVGLLARAHARNLEVIITLALATGTFSLANAVHMSGPIAVVMAGLWIGSNRAQIAMTDETRHELHMFWSLIDEVLNALLFLMIGFEVVALPVHVTDFIAAFLAIPIALVVRAISVFVPTIPMQMGNPDRAGALVVLTWGGLRGGISVSLALSLPPHAAERAALLTVCYVIVVFTIVVQGLTMERVSRRFYAAGSPERD